MKLKWNEIPEDFYTRKYTILGHTLHYNVNRKYWNLRMFWKAWLPIYRIRLSMNMGTGTEGGGK